MPPKPEVHPEAAAIGARISALRDRKGLSNGTLADRLGMALSSVKKLVGGQTTVQFVKLGRLARALGSSPDELLGFKVGKSEALLRAALTASYVALGLAVQDAEEFAAVVLQALDEQPTDSVKLDPETGVRVQVELAARRFAREQRARKAPPKKTSL
jgi:transcriptional regulator with XRE-family HTH domain